MSISTIQSRITTLEREILVLEKKIADTEKEEAKLSKDILSAQKAIKSTKSASTINSKQNQISQYETKKVRILENRAKYRKEMSRKSEELGKRRIELQKEQSKADKKAQEQSQRLISDMQKKLREQQQQIVRMKEEAKETLSMQEDKEYDFFISHASEDKESFVSKLATALTERGCRVWYDKFCIKVGDSLRESIDAGLRLSRFGIVVVSKNYTKKYWTKKEFNALFSKESAVGSNLILPIWHEISKDEVAEYSSMLVDKMALNTAVQTVDEIADELKNVLDVT